jgi:HK97 family phage major capsid protein
MASALAMAMGSMAGKSQAVHRGIISGVRADGGNVTQLMAQLNQAFATFKEEHQKQLDEVKKGTADALQALKVEKINADIASITEQINKISLQAATAQLGGADGRKIKDREYSEAFAAHFRKGDVSAAMEKGTATDGGYLTPNEWDRTILDRMVLISPMRGLASQQNISKAEYTKLINMKGTSSGWVGETDARPNTDTPKLVPYSYGLAEIYANPAATQGLLDDAEIDVEKWLAGEVDEEFAVQENRAFWLGDGVKKPKGLLNFADGQALANDHPLGSIEVVGSGKAGGITTDALLDMVFALPSRYTLGAKWTMNRTTEGMLRKLKDDQGNYIWQPGLTAGSPNTLLGYPIQEVPDMPDVAANGLSIAFGNFAQTYLVIDRMGVRVLRDPYTNKPYVQFYTTKRVGGGLLNPEPMRIMKIGA